MINIKQNSLILVDLDGTLCIGECWTEEKCLSAEPREDMIALVEKLYKQGYRIIIHTARKENLRFATEYWLRKHGVWYNALDLGTKKPCDLYIDDKAIRPEEAIEFFNGGLTNKIKRV